MPSKILPLLLFPLMLVSAACSDAGEQAGVTEDPGRFQTPQESEHAPAASVEHTADHDEHDALPLRPIMIQLAADLAGFTHAMWVEDYETMSQRAHAMADHTHISEEEMERIRSILGSEMADFEAADERVHLLAEQLHRDAEGRDLGAVLGSLAETQTACMACHTQFRERLRTDL